MLNELFHIRQRNLSSITTEKTVGIPVYQIIASKQLN
jgi:hypothetical protein